MAHKHRHAGAAAGSEIAREHAMLRKTLQQLSGAAGPKAIADTLRELDVLLRDHFKNEESAGGLAATISPSAPQLISRVDALNAQHAIFLRTVQSLLRESQAVQDAQQNLVQNVQHLIHDLEEHEQAETKLLMDSVYTDIGPSD